MGYGVRLGLRLVKGIGEEHGTCSTPSSGAGPTHGWRTSSSGRGSGGGDRAADPRRGPGFAGPAAARAALAVARGRGRDRGGATAVAGRRAPRADRWTCDSRATDAPALPAITERNGWAIPTPSSASCPPPGRRPVPAGPRPTRCGDECALADRGRGPVRLGGLVVTRQHPMTAKGTVFLALEDETGMVNVTLWPDLWARLRGVVRRHALLLVDGDAPARGVGGQPPSPPKFGPSSRSRPPPVALRSSRGASASWDMAGCDGWASGGPRPSGRSSGLAVSVALRFPSPAADGPPIWVRQRLRNRRYQAAAEAKKAPMIG